VVQTVTWLSDLPKKFAIRLVNESVSVKCSKCQSSSHGLSRYSIDTVFVIGSKLTGISGYGISEFIDNKSIEETMQRRAL